MIRQQFNVRHYWKVIVYYNLDDDFFFTVLKELEGIGFSESSSTEILEEILSGYAKAVTCSNEMCSTSIVIFGRHETIKDYLNSIVHEAEHVKQAMLRAYNIEDLGEPPAYTIGYLFMRMWEVFGKELYR